MERPINMCRRRHHRIVEEVILAEVSVFTQIFCASNEDWIRTDPDHHGRLYIVMTRL